MMDKKDHPCSCIWAQADEENWDQWFPETARAMAVKGAELIFYPTAIGSEPILECDSMPHWRRCMQGHAASNLVPVIAANRIGLEKVEKTKENGYQESSP